ncbi:hypothetical protein AAHA92_19033 [Salvia divinorum]|uniref:DNA binding protein n=1 Tax=Salvia divinorum TaxID=28513 RepID=A0ABD1H7N0_SALDI
MGKTRKDDNKSDDIEIISIGKLYNGAWDKKYWSSSRGKDRYPYPVGYKSVRTQNGITYSMEITEGLKGPLFKISSTDGKMCSGDTPEIAWESFQKKGSSKALPARRFSCKIDALEFFGFKNTFVLRLLRELATNVGGPAEQSLIISNFSAGAQEANFQLQGKPSPPDPGPDSMACLFKSHGKGKRSRNGRRRLNETPLELLQKEENTKNVSCSISNQRDRSNSRSGDLSTFAAANEVSGVCYTQGSLRPQKCMPIAEGDVKLDTLDNIGESPSEGKELTSSVNNIENNIDNLHKQQESSDGASCSGVQNNIIPEDRDGATNVQHDILVASTDLCVADSLESGDSSFVSSQNKDVLEHSTEEDATINDVKNPEVLVTDSLPEDEIVKASSYNTNSEKCDECDAESVGDEIAKSMMAILLPRAVPLLKTFHRKKKKSKKSSNTQRSQENNDMPSTTMNDSTTVRGLVEHSAMQGKSEKACIPCAVRDSAVCTSVNLDSVVPDSFDNYSTQELLHHADVVQSGRFSHDLCVPEQLPINGEMCGLPCHSGNSKPDTGKTGLTSKAVADAVSHEVTADSKQARFDNSSIDNMIPTTDCENAPSNIQLPTTSCYTLTGNVKMSDDSRSNIQQKLKSQDDLGLFACYIHPMPISMVQLIVKENEIFTCVKCGYSEHKDDILFVYKTSKKGENMGCPSLVGHVPISLQISKDIIGRDIASERSLLQLTPDGESLVLLNSIKIPHCREGKLECLCSACTSDGFEKNAVKIVRLNSGYASLVTRLKTAQGVCSLLVCEPNFLLAAEEDGKLKLWDMNSAWSGQKEDWYLPTFDCMFPCIVELKIVPNSAALIIGHNGFGTFGIWDIDKRRLVSRFSCADMSVMECIPVSIFRWQRKGEYMTEALVTEIMDATKIWSSGRSDNNHLFSAEDKDVAAWLLISTASDLDDESYHSCEQEKESADRCWRLALLVNEMVITGSVLDEGATAAAAMPAGHGIIARRDGQVYMLELSTGKKLGNLQTFQGNRVSCITTDTSNMGALAIASEEQLLVYLP